MEASAEPQWGSVAEAARHLEVNPATVRRMIDRGDVYAERVGPRLIRVDLASVKRQPLGPAAPRTIKRSESIDERIVAGVDE
ncbi:helix-turn-helix domain-containing protein [Microbacterium terregens]|uniref:Helix-turn-helix domain-containing protein n=1 Tax=Microbacterium terregens TaxID=69363 RepID=A0ABV5SZJ0_9MICO